MQKLLLWTRCRYYLTHSELAVHWVALQVRNLKKLFDVTDVVDDVQGVVDDTVQRTTDNLHQALSFDCACPSRLCLFILKAAGRQQPGFSATCSAAGR